MKKVGLLKIYEEGKTYKMNQALSLSQNILLNVTSSEGKNPDMKIPFINLKNVFLRPNIDEGKFDLILISLTDKINKR